jgi:DNA-directed RNA polymerase subunit RPC12/RpoP
MRRAISFNPDGLGSEPQKQDFEKETNYDTKESLVSPDFSIIEATQFLSKLREEYVEYQCSRCQHKVQYGRTSPSQTCPKCKSSYEVLRRV